MPQLHSLPLFPLGLVLYPRQRLPLHIFEPRYREMIAFCRREEAPFGVVLAQEDAMQRVGCTARLVEVARTYDDGRLDVVVEGEQRFRITAVDDAGPYLRADVDLLEDVDEPVARDARQRVITQHMKLLELAGRTVRPTRYDETPRVSFFIAHNAGLSLEQKQHVLELDGENERIALLVGHLEAMIPKVEQKEEVRRRIQSNGHFQDLPPADG